MNSAASTRFLFPAGGRCSGLIACISAVLDVVSAQCLHGSPWNQLSDHNALYLRIANLLKTAYKTVSMKTRADWRDLQAEKPPSRWRSKENLANGWSSYLKLRRSFSREASRANPARKASSTVKKRFYFVQRELEGLTQDEAPSALLVCDRGSLDGRRLLARMMRRLFWMRSRARSITSFHATNGFCHLDTAPPAFLRPHESAAHGRVR